MNLRTLLWIIVAVFLVAIITKTPIGGVTP